MEVGTGHGQETEGPSRGSIDKGGSRISGQRKANHRQLGQLMLYRSAEGGDEFDE